MTLVTIVTLVCIIGFYARAPRDNLESPSRTSRTSRGPVFMAKPAAGTEAGLPKLGGNREGVVCMGP